MSDTHESMFQELVRLRAEVKQLSAMVSGQQQMSVEMVRMTAKAKELEEDYFKREFETRKNVVVVHEEGTVLFFRYAFAVLYYDEDHENWGAAELPGQWLFVYTEHHGIHVYGRAA